MQMLAGSPPQLASLPAGLQEAVRARDVGRFQVGAAQLGAALCKWWHDISQGAVVWVACGKLGQAWRSAAIGAKGPQQPRQACSHAQPRSPMHRPSPCAPGPLQSELRGMAEERRRAEEEQARFRRLAEEDPFNPEVQVSGTSRRLPC